MLAFLTRPVHRFGRVNEKRTLLLDDSPDLASLYESVERRGLFPVVESCVSISESSSDSSLRSDSSTRFCFPFLRESLSDLNTLTLKKFCMTRLLILYFLLSVERVSKTPKQNKRCRTHSLGFSRNTKLQKFGELLSLGQYFSPIFCLTRNSSVISRSSSRCLTHFLMSAPRVPLLDMKWSRNSRTSLQNSLQRGSVRSPMRSFSRKSPSVGISHFLTVIFTSGRRSCSAS